MTGKRANYITWDEYFMGVASLSAMRSKAVSYTHLVFPAA